MPDLETTNEEEYKKALKKWQEAVETKIDVNSRLIAQVAYQLEKISKLINK